MPTTGGDYEIGLSTKLFGAGLAGNQDELDRFLVDLTDHTGDRSIFGPMVLAWIDSSLEFLGVDPGSVVQLGDLANGQVALLADLPDELAWATRLVAARAVADDTDVITLMSALPADNNGTRTYLRSLLNLLGVTLRRAQARHDENARTADTQATAVSAGWPGRAAAHRHNAALN